MKQETKCLHSGYVPKNGEPRQMPIYQSTTFKYDSSDAMGRLFDLEDSGYFYSRLQNPSNDMTAAKIADLEGGIAAMLTSQKKAVEDKLKEDGLKNTPKPQGAGGNDGLTSAEKIAEKLATDRATIAKTAAEGLKKYI